MEQHFDKYLAYDQWLDIIADLHKTKKPDDIFRDCLSQVRTNPGNAERHFVLGLIYEIMNEYDKAITEYHLGLTIDRLYWNLNLALGNIYIKSCNYDNAAEQFKLALNKNINLEYAYLALGKINVTLKNFDEACQQFTTALKINVNCSEGYLGLAEVYKSQDNYKKALDQYSIALSKNDKPETYLRIADIYVKMSDYVKAAECFKTAIKLMPHKAEPFIGLAAVYYLQHEYAKSMEPLEKALKYEPNNALAYSGLALANLRLGNYDESLMLYSISIKKDPELAHSYFGLGLYHQNIRGDWKKAKTYFETAIEKNPDLSVAYAELGNSYLMAGEYAKAEELCRVAIVKDRSMGICWHNLGSVIMMYSPDRFVEAISYFNRAIYLGWSDATLQLLKIFSEAVDAPFQLRNILNQTFVNTKAWLYKDALIKNAEDCLSIDRLLAYYEPELYMNGNNNLYTSFKAICFYYMGDPGNAHAIYLDQIDQGKTLEEFEVQDLFYFIKAKIGFSEPYLDVLSRAKTIISSKQYLEPEQVLYAGQIYLLDQDHRNAIEVLETIKGGYPKALYLLYNIFESSRDEENKVVIENELLEIEQRDLSNEYIYGTSRIKVKPDLAFNQLFRSFLDIVGCYEIEESVLSFRCLSGVDIEFICEPIYLIFELHKDFIEALKQRTIDTFKNDLIDEFEITDIASNINHNITRFKSNVNRKDLLFKLESQLAVEPKLSEKYIAMEIYKWGELSKKDFLYIIQYFYIKAVITTEEALLLSFYVVKRNLQKHPVYSIVTMVLEDELKEVMVDIIKIDKVLGDIPAIGIATAVVQLFKKFISFSNYDNDFEHYTEFKEGFFEFAYELRQAIGQEDFNRYYSLDTIVKPL